MVNRDATLEELMRDRHPQIGLFVVFMRPTAENQPPTTPEGAEMLRRHLVYLWELEARGVLFASGPLDFKTPRQEGMCILAVATRDEAESIAAAEPYAQAGWRKNEVRAWDLNEGESVALGQSMRQRARA